MASRWCRVGVVGVWVWGAGLAHAQPAAPPSEPEPVPAPDASPPTLAPAASEPDAPATSTTEPATPPPDAQAATTPENDPDWIASVPVEVEPPAPRPPYPRALSDRPVQLPDGMIEGRSLLEVGRVERDDREVFSTSLTLGVRYAIGRLEAELAAAAVLTVFEGADIVDGDRLYALLAAARYAPTAGLSMGLELVQSDPAVGVTSVAPRLVFVAKPGRSPTVGHQLAIRSGIEHDRVERNGREVESGTFSVTTAELRGQYQLHPWVALEVRAAGHLVHVLSSRREYSYVLDVDPPTRLAHDVGGRLVGSVTDRLDVTAGVDLATSVDPFVYVFTVGLILRNGS